MFHVLEVVQNFLYIKFEILTGSDNVITSTLAKFFLFFPNDSILYYKDHILLPMIKHNFTLYVPTEDLSWFIAYRNEIKSKGIMDILRKSYEETHTSE